MKHAWESREVQDLKLCFRPLLPLQSDLVSLIFMQTSTKFYKWDSLLCQLNFLSEKGPK